MKPLLTGKKPVLEIYPDLWKHLISLHRAMQGFPKASALWERMMQDVLLNKKGFKTTTHK